MTGIAILILLILTIIGSSVGLFMYPLITSIVVIVMSCLIAAILPFASQIGFAMGIAGMAFPPLALAVIPLFYLSTVFERIYQFIGIKEKKQEQQDGLWIYNENTQKMEKIQ